MELRVLHYFLTVAEIGSITKAADYLHITQPTLSRRLMQLEDEVGVSLFNRKNRKFQLTNEGLLLCRRAKEILSLVEKTEKELVQQEQTVEGTISIGCGELASMQYVAEQIAQFHRKYPLVRFDLHTANAEHVRERMERGLVDIGLLLEPVDIDKFEFFRLQVQEKWVVLMRPNDVLAEKAFVTPKDLAKLPVCLVKRSNVQNIIVNWFGKYYQNLNILFTGNLSTNAAVMVMQGLVYTIALEGSLPYWDASKICYRPLSPELYSTVVLAWKRNQPQSLAVSKFIEHLKNSLCDCCTASRL